MIHQILQRMGKDELLDKCCSSKSVLPECKYLPVIVKAGVGFVFSTNEQSGVFRKSCFSASQGKYTFAFDEVSWVSAPAACCTGREVLSSSFRKNCRQVFVAVLFHSLPLRVYTYC